MSIFTYTASDKDGKIVQGKVDSPDRETAAKNIIEQGLTPLKIKDSQSISLSNLGDLNSINIGKVPIKDRVIFFRQLSVLINSGIPITEALDITYNQVTNKGLKKILASVEKSVESGKNLSDSFEPYTKLFTSMQIQLLRTAEASGSLDYILDRMADDIENESKLISKLRGAMIYPILVIIVATVVIGLVVTEMVPPMKNLYASFNATLPWPTLFIIDVSNFVTNYWVIGLIIVIIIGASFYLYTRSSQGKKSLDRIVLKIPLFGGLIEKIQVINFGKTFVLLTKAGVPLVQGLNLISNSLSNTLYSDTVKELADEVEKGKSLSDVMSKYSIFPPLLWRMIGIGEQTGNMEEVVSKVIEYYVDETTNLIDNLSKIMEPVITIFLGVIVGFIGVAVYLPIYTLGSVIK
jgi:type IV pilus assembly protein PilC